MKTSVSPAQFPLFLIISGPSGTGKTTLTSRMIERYQPRMERVVTATTRPVRKGEEDGVDYHFYGPDTFRQMISREAFFEYAEVHGNLYGTPRSSVTEPLSRGVDVITSVDVQGAASFRKVCAGWPAEVGRLVTVFVLPKDLHQLKKRLVGRGDVGEEEMEQRLRNAQVEMRRVGEFDYWFASGSREEDLACVDAIYRAEKLRVVH